MYEKMYKCRMCGDTFTKDIITDELKASSVLTDLCNRRDNGLHVIHYCSTNHQKEKINWWLVFFCLDIRTYVCYSREYKNRRSI